MSFEVGIVFLLQLLLIGFSTGALALIIASHNSLPFFKPKNFIFPSLAGSFFMGIVCVVLDSTTINQLMPLGLAFLGAVAGSILGFMSIDPNSTSEKTQTN